MEEQKLSLSMVEAGMMGCGAAGDKPVRQNRAFPKRKAPILSRFRPHSVSLMPSTRQLLGIYFLFSN